MELWPTAEEARALGNIESVRAWAGLAPAAWAAVDAAVGSPPNLRILALVPPEVIGPVVMRARVPVPATGEDEEGSLPERELTPVEAVMATLIWRVARRLLGLPDVDVLAPKPSQGEPAAFGTAGPASSGASPAGSKKIKCATVIDQGDETEIRALTSKEVAGHFENHVAVTGAEPLPEAEPSPEQISAMADKVIARDEEPYADFSVLTPFGRRMQKTLRLRSWLLQQDGSYRPIDVPGPPSYEAWFACWKVYKSILYMLRYGAPEAGQARDACVPVVTPAALEEYLEHFRQLASDFPECWYLCAVAEDRCRGERFPRLRRELERQYEAGALPPGVKYNPAQPWDGVFQAAARDDRYWDKEVRRPATAFLARGSARDAAGVSAAAAEATRGMLAAGAGTRSAAAAGLGAGAPPAGGKRSKRQKRAAAAAAAAQAGVAALPPPPPALQPTSRGERPGHYSRTREGGEICFRFAKGARGACDAVCPEGRAHVCMWCLQPHRNDECPTAKEAKGKGRGKAK